METIWEKVENDHGCRTPELLPESIREKEEECNSSSSSSSIGDDSDLDRDDDDVESSYNGSFDNAIQALEQALPIRRGISNYYNGRSKSFTTLLDDSTSSSSIQDVAKPENAYSRKRRNLVAFKLSKIKTKTISKKPKTTPTFTRHASTQSQINIQLPRRSLSMINMHRCTAAKIGNC